MGWNTRKGQKPWICNSSISFTVITSHCNHEIAPVYNMWRYHIVWISDCHRMWQQSSFDATTKKDTTCVCVCVYTFTINLKSEKTHGLKMMHVTCRTIIDSLRRNTGLFMHLIDSGERESERETQVITTHTMGGERRGMTWTQQGNQSLLTAFTPLWDAS